MSKNYLIVIPARTGSKGILNKNFLYLGEKQVIRYSIDHAFKLLPYCDIVVSTDNFEYLENFAKEMGSHQSLEKRLVREPLIKVSEGIFIHFRGSLLSEDTSHIIDVLKEVTNLLAIQGRFYEGVILLQPTVPFRSKLDLRRIESFISNGPGIYDSFVTFKEVNDIHPARMYKSEDLALFEAVGIYPEFESTRRQELPKLYLRDGCYYYIGSALLKAGRQVGKSPKGYIRIFPWNINLDEPPDLVLAKSALDLFLQKEGASSWETFA